MCSISMPIGYKNRVGKSLGFFGHSNVGIIVAAGEEFSYILVTCFTELETIKILSKPGLVKWHDILLSRTIN